MALFRHEVRNDAGPEIYMVDLPFADSEFARVIEYCQRTYANADGSLPTPEVAWARAAAATANIILQRAYDMERNITASGVPPPTNIPPPTPQDTPQ